MTCKKCRETHTTKCTLQLTFGGQIMKKITDTKIHVSVFNQSTVSGLRLINMLREKIIFIFFKMSCVTLKEAK